MLKEFQPESNANNSTSAITAPANMIHYYQVMVKWIDATFSPKYLKEHIFFKVKDCVWAKNLQNQSTSKCQLE